MLIFNWKKVARGQFYSISVHPPVPFIQNEDQKLLRSFLFSVTMGFGLIWYDFLK